MGGKKELPPIVKIGLLGGKKELPPVVKKGILGGKKELPPVLGGKMELPPVAENMRIIGMQRIAVVMRVVQQVQVAVKVKDGERTVNQGKLPQKGKWKSQR